MADKLYSGGIIVGIRKRITAFVACAAICLSFFNQNVYADTAITISTANDLLNFAENFNNKLYNGRTCVVTVTSDIDLDGASITPIGEKNNPFTFSFNGNNHTVKNFSISDNENYYGLFGYIKDAEISNLNIVNATINPPSVSEKNIYAGIIAGYIDNGKIVQCSVSDSGAAIVSKGKTLTCCGGITGYNGGIITNTNFSGKLSFTINALSKIGKTSEHSPNVAALNTNTGTGDDYRANYADSYAGGITAVNKGIISDCTADCTSEAEAKYSSAASGGIAGDNAGTVQNCTSKGKTVSHLIISKDKGYSYAGGICGTNTYKVSNCTSGSEVYSYGLSCPIKYDVAIDAGGICGYNSSLITKCTSSGTVKAKLAHAKNAVYVSNAGGCVGYNSGKIYKCSSSGSILCRSGYAGGIVGKNKNGFVALSNYTPTSGNVLKTDMDIRYNGNFYTDSQIRCIGGLAAVNEGGTITKCFSKSNVLAMTDRDGHYFTAAGFACENDGTIDNCFFTGTVCGNDVSAFVNNNSGNIRNCYSAAKLGDEPYGGMSASHSCIKNSGIITSCYSDITVFKSDVQDRFGAVTELMKSADLYTNWDFDSIWRISKGENNGYPTLNESASNPPFTAGNGTKDNPYTISTQQELAQISLYPDRNFILTNDITLSDEWQPVGSTAKPFSGSLNGNGYSVYGVRISSPVKYMGLFGITRGATIKNLNITAEFSASDKLPNELIYAGGAAAFAENTTIENVSAECVMNFKNINSVSGNIAGFLSGNVSASRANGNIVIENNLENVNTKCGGIIGILSGTMTGCKGNCAIKFGTTAAQRSAPTAYIGGLCGMLTGEISGCALTAEMPSAMGTVSSNIITAGIAAVINGNINYTSYCSGIPFGLIYNGSASNSGSESDNPDILNRGLEKNSFPWVSGQNGELDILHADVHSKPGDDVDTQIISVYCQNDTYCEINGVKKLCTSDFSAAAGSEIKFSTIIGEKEYMLNSYIVTESDDNPLVIISGANGNVNNSLFDNISQVSSLEFSIYSKVNIPDTLVYVAAYDEGGNVGTVCSSKINIKRGNNNIVLNNLKFSDDITQLRIFAWNGSACPYAADKTLTKSK